MFLNFLCISYWHLCNEMMSLQPYFRARSRGTYSLLRRLWSTHMDMKEMQPLKHRQQRTSQGVRGEEVLGGQLCVTVRSSVKSYQAQAAMLPHDALVGMKTLCSQPLWTTAAVDQLYILSNPFFVRCGRTASGQSVRYVPQNSGSQVERTSINQRSQTKVLSLRKTWHWSRVGGQSLFTHQERGVMIWLLLSTLLLAGWYCTCAGILQCFTHSQSPRHATGSR